MLFFLPGGPSTLSGSPHLVGLVETTAKQSNMLIWDKSRPFCTHVLYRRLRTAELEGGTLEINESSPPKEVQWRNQTPSLCDVTLGIPWMELDLEGGRHLRWIEGQGRKHVEFEIVLTISRICTGPEPQGLPKGLAYRVRSPTC